MMRQRHMQRVNDTLISILLQLKEFSLRISVEGNLSRHRMPVSPLS